MKWKMDEFDDCYTYIENEGCATVTGTIVKCSRSRWMLLINHNFYGFWTSLDEAKSKFKKTFPRDKKT